jgi:hypothetical protein
VIEIGYNMQDIVSLDTLYKRDTKGKIRVLTIQVGSVEDGVYGTRSVAGTQDGKLVTSEWNISKPKNLGKKNGTTSKTQAESEAKASWDKKLEKEYFLDILYVEAHVSGRLYS